MRTTLDIDEDVLLAAKSLAEQQNRSAGKVLSELARKGLHKEASHTLRNGVPLFTKKPNAKAVTMELVNRLRDENP